ncbi:MAG TPA: hypothetical protein H9900_04015, partial [Candidatus Monoglobus merdigallinarum]|nr:hypothetical protein [Candidatus Monoglobus merdigallinarum]
MADKTEKGTAKPKRKSAAKSKVQLTGNEYLNYKDKKLVRVGDKICYGNEGDPYMVVFRLEDNQELKDITVSKRVIIELMSVDGKRTKLIRQAERDGLYKAF